MEILNSQGFDWIRQAIDRDQLSQVISAIEAQPNSGNIRNILSNIHALKQTAKDITKLLPRQNGKPPKLIRSILFNKNPKKNWAVLWHQDLTICVKEKHHIPGFGPWSVKHHVPHVQPPIAFLQQMLTARLHLDDCPETNGPLNIIPTSHNHGLLSRQQIEEFNINKEVISYEAQAGDLLLMKPLILHSSPKATQPQNRRILHLEFTYEDLLMPLEFGECLK